jgi:hypothetical protein
MLIAPTWRKLSDSEIQQLRRNHLGVHGCLSTLLMPVSLGGCAVLLIYFGIAAVLALLRHFNIEALAGDRAAGPETILPLIVGLVVGWYFQLDIRRAQRRLRADLAKGDVELFSIKPSRTLRQRQGDPSIDRYFYDVGESTILVLQGVWDQTFKKGIAENEDEDPPVDPRQRLPSTLFSIQRLPTYGLILGVEVQGDPLEPMGDLPGKIALPTSWKLLQGEGLKDSFSLWQGDFEDLVRLARA